MGFGEKEHDDDFERNWCYVSVFIVFLIAFKCL